MEIVFLGTSSMVPTKDRNVQGIYLEYKGEGILIDCGEGTQRQMSIAGINRNKVKKILISHWHGDHTAGLIGLIQTIGNIEENKILEIYGPKGTKKYIKHMLQSCAFYNKVNLKITEINPKKLTLFFENNDYQLSAAKLDHSVPCIGYSFVEKDKFKINMQKAKKFGLQESPILADIKLGKTIKFNSQTISPNEICEIVSGQKISFILDTQLCNGCYELAQNADILISECVYAGELENKAEQYKHMTAKQAANLASQSNVKKLILTHFSQRYKDITEVQEDARNIFPDTECAYDFMKIKL